MTMNCQRFQENLQEFLDGSGSRRQKVAAQRHLAGCAACRAILEAEKEFTRHLTNQFQRAAGPLTLSAQGQNRILSAFARAHLGGTTKNEQMDPSPQPSPLRKGRGRTLGPVVPSRCAPFARTGEIQDKSPFWTSYLRKLVWPSATAAALILLIPILFRSA